MATGEPAISVDTKKNELVGDFKNAGREWRPKGSPEPVRVHDFLMQLVRAVPYGVYDIGRERRLGQRWRRSRPGELRRQCHPPLVAEDGASTLSQCQAALDHRRRRRQQRNTPAPVEERLWYMSRKTRHIISLALFVDQCRCQAFHANPPVGTSSRPVLWFDRHHPSASSARACCRRAMAVKDPQTQFYAGK